MRGKKGKNGGHVLREKQCAGGGAEKDFEEHCWQLGLFVTADLL